MNIDFRRISAAACVSTICLFSAACLSSQREIAHQEPLLLKARPKLYTQPSYGPQVITLGAGDRLGSSVASSQVARIESTEGALASEQAGQLGTGHEEAVAPE